MSGSLISLTMSFVSAWRQAMKTKLSSPFVSFLLLITLLYFVVFSNDLRLLSSSFAPCISTTTPQPSARHGAADFRVLLGVLTTARSYERRSLLRLAYALQPPPSRAAIDIRFVLCRVASEEDRVLVALEIIAHGDIVVLNCTENMNEGKTHTYFSSVPLIFGADHYDYVGKVDDDALYRLAALADTLRAKPRRDLYHGFLVPCGKAVDPNAEWQFMAGYGYIVSWDVAAWISENAELRNDTTGAEDVVFRRWLWQGGRGKNMYGEGPPRMLDYIDRDIPNPMCAEHRLTADTVAIHKLKTSLRWARTLKFFNATQGLKPSKMYPSDLL